MIEDILTVEDEQGTDRAIAYMEKLITDHNEEFDGKLQKYFNRNKWIRILELIRIGFPEFEAVDWNGNPFRIEDYKGKVLLIDFWATWCVPCVGEIPPLVEAYKKYHNKGFEIIGISFDYSERKTVDELREWCKEKNMPWEQIYNGLGWNNPIRKKFSITSIPTKILIDRTGKGHPGKRGKDLISQIESFMERKCFEVFLMVACFFILPECFFYRFKILFFICCFFQIFGECFNPPFSVVF